MNSTTAKAFRRTLSCVILFVSAFALIGCPSTQTGSSPKAQQPSYETAQAAVDALITAARSNDTAGLHTILGADSDKALSTGDEVADANGRAEFLRQYDEKHGLTPGPDGSMILNVGKTDWPCPIPLVKGDKGWYFDTDAGLDEMLNRRIGRNELFAIGVCRALVDAEKEYAAEDADGNGWREYARKFRSDEGKKDGLYWAAKEGEKESPLGELFATAQSEGYGGKTAQGDASAPYHGYYYRILTAQGDAAPGGALDFVAQGHMFGGFGIVAWPVDYGNSGLKTFITSHHGVIYEKDLGDNTASIARSMKTFNPEAGWTPVKDEPADDE